MGLPWTLPRLVGAGVARELSLLPRQGRRPTRPPPSGSSTRRSTTTSFRAEVRGTSSSASPAPRRSPAAGMKAHYVAAESMGFGEFVAIETKAHGTITAVGRLQGGVLGVRREAHSRRFQGK